jgi:hypothetical protein
MGMKKGFRKTGQPKKSKRTKDKGKLKLKGKKCENKGQKRE